MNSSSSHEAGVHFTPENELERKLEQLPLLPAVVTELLSVSPDDEDYFDRLLHLAQRDPPFAVRVLRCANSAASAPATPVVSLHQAVMRLGTQQCAGLVLALAVIKVFVPHSNAQRFLWIHSLQTALFAQMFSQRLLALRTRSEEAYVCGLLHDIGRFVQFEGAPADLAMIDDKHWASTKELVDVERGTLGYDHALLGWHACKKWSLPESIGEVVRRHHEPPPTRFQAPLELLNVVQWADVLSTTLMRNPALIGASPEELGAALASQYPGVGVGWQSPESSWHGHVPDVYAQSLQMARQLHVIPV